MQAVLQHRTTLTGLIWLFPVAFLIHDGEEILTMAPWVADHGDLLAQTPIGPVELTTPQVAIAVALELVLVLIASFRGSRALRRGRMDPFFLAITGVFFLHVFTHVGQALYLGGYTPGVITAPTVALPYSVCLYGRLLRDGVISRADTLRSWAVGALLAVPVVLSVLQIGGWLAP